MTWNNVMDYCDESDFVTIYDWGDQNILELTWLSIEFKGSRNPIKFYSPDEAMKYIHLSFINND